MPKIQAEDCKILSISYLKKRHNLNGVSSCCLVWENRWGEEILFMRLLVDLIDPRGMSVEVRYKVNDSVTGEEVDIQNKYPIVATPCNYGGLRYWFICPASKNGVYCGRRVGKLYLPVGYKYFACRHCYELTYRSKIELYSYTMADVEEREKEIKRMYYDGKETRKYKAVLKIKHKIHRDVFLYSQMLGNRLNKIKTSVGSSYLC